MIAFNTPHTPAEVGYNPERLAALDTHFTRMMQAGQLVSANYCLARDGKVFADRALGRLSYRPEDPREVQPDTIQWIASITKLFCAVAIHKLAEDGLIRLGQPVGELLPEFATPPFNTITPAHLLSHTSGLMADPGCFENKYFKSPWDFIGHMKDTPWLEAALSSGMRTKPGAEWAYCSFGYVVLGEIITRVSGLHAHDYIKQKILDPLGMKDTGFPWIPDGSEADWQRLDAILDRMNIRDAEVETEQNKVRQRVIDPPSPFDAIPNTGGGLYSTARDLCRFGTMLLNQGSLDGVRILGRKTVEHMVAHYTTDQRDYTWGAPGLPRAYGLGPDLRHNDDAVMSPGTFFHEGAGACCLMIDPVEHLVAAWFVPFIKGWFPQGLFGAAAVIWSGLE